MAWGALAGVLRSDYFPGQRADPTQRSGRERQMRKLLLFGGLASIVTLMVPVEAQAAPCEPSGCVGRLRRLFRCQ